MAPWLDKFGGFTVLDLITMRLYSQKDVCTGGRFSGSVFRNPETVGLCRETGYGDQTTTSQVKPKIAFNFGDDYLRSVIVIDNLFSGWYGASNSRNGDGISKKVILCSKPVIPYDEFCFTFNGLGRTLFQVIPYASLDLGDELRKPFAGEISNLAWKSTVFFPVKLISPSLSSSPFASQNFRDGKPVPVSEIYVADTFNSGSSSFFVGNDTDSFDFVHGILASETYFRDARFANDFGSFVLLCCFSCCATCYNNQKLNQYTQKQDETTKASNRINTTPFSVTFFHEDVERTAITSL